MTNFLQSQKKRDDEISYRRVYSHLSIFSEKSPHIHKIEKPENLCKTENEEKLTAEPNESIN